jgi:hypothetical protein
MPARRDDYPPPNQLIVVRRATIPGWAIGSPSCNRTDLRAQFPKACRLGLPSRPMTTDANPLIHGHFA